MWINIIISLAMMAISYAIRPRSPTPKPASLTDIDAPTAETGRPIPVIFGTVRVTGANCIWYGDLTSKAIKKSGGK
jgi:hypothetical protein